MSYLNDPMGAALDAHIMGLNDPNAPFNQEDPRYFVEDTREGEWFICDTQTGERMAGPFASEALAERALEDREEHDLVCENPGKHGCGNCRGCDDWAEREMDRREQADYDRWDERMDRM